MKNAEIPIIFVHKGNPFYLKQIIRQARLFNKNTPIYLLGDKRNKNIGGASWLPFSDYFSSAKEFEKKYLHMSSNSYKFELFCFQRWFILDEFANKEGLENFLYLDSDVLLYCDISQFSSRYLKYDFSVCSGYGPGVSFFSNGSIRKFCNYINELYSKPDYVEKLKKHWNNFHKKRLGGVCDMTAFGFYPQDVSPNVVDLAIPSDGIFWDSNICVSNGFEMENGLKKVYWIDELPYCKFERASEGGGGGGRII